MTKKPKKEQIKPYISPGLVRLVKAVIGVRMDVDLTLGDAVEEGLELWLQQPENQRVIQEHRLERLRGKETQDTDDSTSE